MSDSNDQHSPQERRRDTRFRVPDAVAIVDPDSLPETGGGDEPFSLLMPEVVNESASGICLSFDEPIALATGQQLTLTHDGQTRVAVVCRVSETPAGQIEVGFRWLDSPTS